MTGNPLADTLWCPAPGNRPRRTLLLILPGIDMRPGDFHDHGFVSALHGRAWPVDVAVVHPDLNLYLDASIGGWLHTKVAGPLHARRRYASTWILGVSLGGMGALLYALENGATTDGIVLLAPFLGTPGTVAEVIGAGGLTRWDPGPIVANDGERRALDWLRSRRPDAGDGPKLLLGYGRTDRFVEAHEMLARHLPPRSVVVADGGHDWGTWTTLWRRILDQDPFALAD